MTEQKTRKHNLISGAFDHRVMLADTVRTEAYQRAISEVVKPGMRVLDLGTGTGVLAMMAAKAGAAKVIGVDVDPVVHLAQIIAEDNGYGPERIEFHHCDSRELQLDEPVDCIVTECMGNFYVSDEMQRVLADSARFLAPEGTFLPRSLDLYLAPVFFPQLHEVDFWAQEHYGFRFDAAIPVALNRCYVYHVPGEMIIAPPQHFEHVDFRNAQQDVKGRVEFEVTRSITMHGFVGWFDAQLTDSVTLSTRPGADTTHWGQTVFPVHPTPVKAGDVIKLSIEVNHSGDALDRIQWFGDVTRSGNSVFQFEHDTHHHLG